MYIEHPLLNNTNIAFEQNFKIINYHSNDIIYNENSICNSIGLVLKGTVMISTITYQEKEEIINIINIGELFGDILAFSSNPVYLGNVIAKTNCQIAFIAKDELLSLFTKNSILLSNFLKLLTDKTKEIKNHQKILAHKNIKDRLICYLLYLKEIQQSNIIKIKSITNVANYLSLPRPSVSRSFSELEKKGFIIKNPKQIIIQDAILNNYELSK